MSKVLDSCRARGASLSEEFSDAFSSSASRGIWPLISDHDLLEGYRKSPTSVRGGDLLKELLNRHRNMLRKVCWRYSQAYALSFEDLMQHAYVGAILAYNRYDLLMKDRVKISSWVQKNVEHYLLDAMNREAPISIPSYMRPIRSYLSGRYDHQPEKKAAFEAKHNIKDEADRERLAGRHSLLRPEFFSMNQPVSDSTGACRHDSLGHQIANSRAECIEEDLIQRLDLEMAMRQLTHRQKKVCELCIQAEYTVKEAAQILTDEMGEEITPNMVRYDLKVARQTMRLAL